MNDIGAFLRARLDDDERIAREAGAGTWTRECGHLGWEGEELPPSHDTCCVVAGDIHIYDEGGHSPEQADHIACWDPARVLAEVETKRRLLDEIVPEVDQMDWQIDQEFGTSADSPSLGPAERLLRILAQVYADHPDYDPAWTPGLPRMTR